MSIQNRTPVAADARAPVPDFTPVPRQDRHDGFTTKLHARCGGQGRPLCFVLTPGQAHDVKDFRALFEMLADRIEALLADEGCDADAIHEELAKAGVETVIPAKSNRRTRSRMIGRNTAGAISLRDCSTS